MRAYYIIMSQQSRSPVNHYFSIFCEENVYLVFLLLFRGCVITVKTSVQDLPSPPLCTHREIETTRTHLW